MRKLLYLLTLAAVLLAVQATAFSQSQPTFTTLSAAIADERTTHVSVTSATGFVASNGATGLNYGMFVDNEFMKITAVSGTVITVIRGEQRTQATSHASLSYVIVGQYGSQQQSSTQTGGPFIQSQPLGSCTRTNYPYLPLVQVNAAALGGQAMYDCVNGSWAQQTLLGAVYQPALYKACTAPIGSVAYGSMGTSTTASTTAQYTASVWVPATFVATGITNLNGSAVDTASKKVIILYSGSGRLIANSLATGTLATGNDSFQAIAFTATKIVTGPAMYFIGLQDDTADVNGIRTIAASTFNNVIGSSITSVFGTVASSITPPTTFTADVAPLACIY